MEILEDKKLEKYLKKNNISYNLYEHAPVFTVEESKSIKANIPGAHSKNLFLKDSKGNFYLVCLPAEKRLNIKALRKKINKKKLHFASPEELKEHLNLTPGSVSIFGMIYAKSVTLLLDKDIWKSDIVSFHPNINSATLELSHKDLEKFYNSLKASKEIIELE